MTINVTMRDRGLWITIDRPERRNALTEAMFAALAAAFARAATADDCKYVMVTGVGRDFCAGGDVAEFDKLLGQSAEQQANGAAGQYAKLTMPWFRAVVAVPQPVIVAARGNAIGAGAQLIFAADLVIVSDTLKLAVPQVKLGHVLDHGESISLPRKVGLAKAMEIALLGDAMDADFALRAGIANWIVLDGSLEAEADKLAGRMAGSAGMALRETKALLATSGNAEWENRLRQEGEAFARCVHSPDFREAIVAFGEKRRPDFR